MDVNTCVIPYLTKMEVSKKLGKKPNLSGSDRANQEFLIQGL